MSLAGVRAGAVLCCDVRGDRFYALARAAAAEEKVQITSLTGRPIPALRVGARQVIGHWRKSKASRV